MKVAFFFLYLIQLLPFAAIQKLADAIGSPPGLSGGWLGTMSKS